MKDKERKFGNLENKLKDMEDEHSTKYQLLEQSAQNQITYLQRRIKEVAEET